ncbi:hypothetical protein H0X32_04330 [Patescibacteria group bacterium]|nr:hypothetical protein [Patescibacteria group bacterium]
MQVKFRNGTYELDAAHLADLIADMNLDWPTGDCTIEDLSGLYYCESCNELRIEAELLKCDFSGKKACDCQIESIDGNWIHIDHLVDYVRECKEYDDEREELNNYYDYRR